MDCSPPGSSVHGISQIRLLEWVAMPSSRGSSWFGIEPVSLMSAKLEGSFFITSATWEPKGGWVPKNWCFWSVVLKKTLESTLDCKEIKPVNPERNQSWIFIGRTDAEAEAPIHWPPYVKNWLLGKDPDVGKDWGQEEKRATKDEMVGWHYRLNRHEFE